MNLRPKCTAALTEALMRFEMDRVQAKYSGSSNATSNTLTTYIIAFMEITIHNSRLIIPRI